VITAKLHSKGVKKSKNEAAAVGSPREHNSYISRYLVVSAPARRRDRIIEAERVEKRYINLIFLKLLVSESNNPGNESKVKDKPIKKTEKEITSRNLQWN